MAIPNNDIENDNNNNNGNDNTPYKYHKKLIILDQTLKHIEEIGLAKTLGKIY